MNNLILDPLQDGKSRIELIDYMGNDLSVVNDARASFDRISEELSEQDKKLIKYLINHKHYSTLRGTAFKFRVKCPLFTVRQWVKHIIASNHNDEQLGFNEKSLRYVSVQDDSDYYLPDTFRKQSENNKQATEGSLTALANSTATNIYDTQCRNSYEAYCKLLDLGVGREQARAVLVPAFYTNFVWTVSLQSLLNFIDLRKGKGAQQEIALYAEAIEKLISPIVPVVMEYWNEKN